MDFVQLYWKRNRGWPWPESSWGLTAMFGEDGWCHSCGVPRHPQTGALTLQRKGLTPLSGAWVPNWQFEAICLTGLVADEVASRFKVDLREISWHGSAPGKALQIVVPTVGGAWFDPSDLQEKAIARHGTAGAACPECGVWRWMPMTFGLLPPLQFGEAWTGRDVIASPEWFGDGSQSYRQVLVRRELAQLIASASPKDFKVQEVS